MASGEIKVTQIGSPIGRKPNQRKTLIAMKLNKLHRTAVLKDTPENRGRIRVVQHLVRVDEGA